MFATPLPKHRMTRHNHKHDATSRQQDRTTPSATTTPTNTKEHNLPTIRTPQAMAAISPISPTATTGENTQCHAGPADSKEHNLPTNRTRQDDNPKTICRPIRTRRNTKEHNLPTKQATRHRGTHSPRGTYNATRSPTARGNPLPPTKGRGTPPA